MARLKRTRSALNNESDPVVSTSDDAHTEDGVPVGDEEPLQKKRKHEKSGAEPKQKKVIPLQYSSDLSALWEDILIKIFSYLRPLDLLHLSWTTKGLHKLLTADHLVYVWKKARKQNILKGLPDCPVGMKEPEYANLVFGDYCSFCLRRSYEPRQMTWSGPFRACIGCLEKKTLFVYIDEDDHEANGRLKGYPEDIFKRCLPSIKVLFSDRMYYHLGTHKKWEQEYRMSKNKKRWQESKSKAEKTFRDFASRCQTWRHNWDKFLVRERERMVLKHLRKLGWAKELINLVSHASHPLNAEDIEEACRTRLTERYLIEMEPWLNLLMGCVREDYLADARKAILKKSIPILADVITSCRMQLPPNAITPGVGDVYELPLVHNIINSEPTERDFTKDDFGPVVDAYPEICSQWRLATEAKLAEMIKSAYDKEYTFNPDTIFQLATTMFSCKSCQDGRAPPLCYPRVLIHNHATNRAPFRPALDTDIVCQLTGSAPWNADNQIKFLKNDSLIMSTVLKEFGFDPDTVTAEEMNQRDPIFECVPCNDRRRGRYTMTWIHLAEHISHSHSETGTKPYKFEMLEGQDAEFIRARFAEDNAFDRAYHGYCNSSICVRCREIKPPANMAEHVFEKHGIAEPTDEDIVQNLDIVPFHRHRYSWPPRKVSVQGNIVTA